MSDHPRIDDALAQMRLQFPSMPNAETLAPMIKRKEICDSRGHAHFTLADSSAWVLMDIDLEADTIKLWRWR